MLCDMRNYRRGPMVYASSLNRPGEISMKPPNHLLLMASSVDGRTLHSRWRPGGSGADLFERVHDELAGDAWLVGRVTGLEFAKGKPYPASSGASFPAPALVRTARRQG